MPEHRIFSTGFASVYPLYVQKAERKGRTKEEVDRIICWLTGYSEGDLQRQLQEKSDFRTFFAEAPAIHPNSSLIKGVVCGVRVEEIEVSWRWRTSLEEAHLQGRLQGVVPDRRPAAGDGGAHEHRRAARGATRAR